VPAVSYEIDMERDADRGLDRYRIVVGERFTTGDAHELSDWMAVAAQNPTATFRIDLARISSGSGRPLGTMLARTSWLRTRRRVEIVRRDLAPGAA
jgi:hypothetical protein